MRLLGLLFACLIATSAQAELVKMTAEVLSADGVCSCTLPNGETSALKPGMALPEGTVITTEAEAKASLRLGNSSKLDIEPSAQVVLSRMDGTGHKPGEPRFVEKEGVLTETGVSVVNIEVKRGKVTGDTRGVNKNSQYTIRTPVGTTRIRG